MNRDLPNQPAALPDHDAWAADDSLRWWAAAFGVPADPALESLGAFVGSSRARGLARSANENPPALRDGQHVEFDPSWHELLGEVLGSGIAGMPWRDDHGYVRRAAAFEMCARLDMGVMCPVSMTTAALPVLRSHALGDQREWIDALANQVGGARTAGMAMTEPQGGSDLSRSATVAEPAGDDTWHLTGFKWFCSHPVADVLLVLAREPGAAAGSRGLSCFLVPRHLPDGSHNSWQVERLKDKLGTHSLASAELQLDGARATRLGGAGDGIRTIIDMVTHTRLDCAVGSTGVITRAVQEATWFARQREVAGGVLADQPAMRLVLADLALEREASLALAFDVARSFDASDPLGRLTTAVGKYWITRRAVSACIEAVEALGGNGYTEAFDLARLYRDAQVNSTWEGSGNVIALDVLRALTRQPELEPLLHDRVDELLAGATDATAAATRECLHRALAAPRDQASARAVTGGIALALQSALLAWRACKQGDEASGLISAAFVATRIESQGAQVFGTADNAGALSTAAEALLDSSL